ncbi:MAG: DegV family protein [Anaerolineales bacterium]|nr:DegV family protein [Anaerolineales bacterium]
MNIGIVTDSTADIPADIATRYQIEIVPANLIIDGQSFADGDGISRETFYARMPAMHVPATTAAPSAGSFIAGYEKLFNAGAKAILSIHAAASLSGIFNAARLAAAAFGERVYVIDSGQLSLGCGFQVLTAAETIARGTGIAETIRQIEQVQERIKVIAVLDTLEYLRRSGRVSWAKARLGSLLKLKPIIELTYGRVENLGAVRTTRLANLRLKEMLYEVRPFERLAVLHTNAETRARKFLAEISLDRKTPPLLINVTTAIGAHLGPNGLGFAVVRNPTSPPSA